MTNEERDQIILLRCQGLSYEKISKALGVKRDTIRAFCKRNGLNGQASDIKESYKKIVIDEFTYKICLYCGKKLEQKKQDEEKNIAVWNVKENGKKGIEKYIFLNVNTVEKSMSPKDLKTENIVAMIAIFEIGFGGKKMPLKS